MSLKLNEYSSVKLRRRPRIVLPAVFYVVVAVLTVITTTASIVMLENYSDRESVIEISLSRIQATAYQLAMIEEKAHADRALDPKSRKVDAAVDAATQKELADISSMGESDLARRVGQIYTRLDADLDDEYNLISTGLHYQAEAYAISFVDPQFALLEQELSRASTVASRKADQANLIALLGTIGVLSLTAIMVSLLFRRFEQSQRSLLMLSTEQSALIQSERRFQALVRNAADLIFIVAPNGSISSVVSAAELMWAHSPESLTGKQMLSLISDEDVWQARDLLDQVCLTEGAIINGELRVRHGDGIYRYTEVVLTNLSDVEGIDGIVMNLRDVSERKAAEAKIAHQAFHDPLTDLPNRALFMERLAHALTRGLRTKDQTAVIFLDLDNFKVVNDSLGHEAGDILLKTVAERLKGLVRPGDTVARLGGDEFTILLEDTHDSESNAVAERIAEAFHAPINIDRRDVFAGASMGIALSRGDYNSAEELLRDADTAMYQAKANAKGHSVAFNTSMNERAVERMELEIDLHNALDRDELLVYYQPIIALNSGEISEVEALVRWQHPTRGMVMPSVFIPIAEESGLIVRLGAWVLEKACNQMIEWDTTPGSIPITLNVNLSVRQLGEPNLVTNIANILDRAGMPPSRLKLEITEGVMMRDPATVTAKLEAIRALGIRIAVDDFGTGYSSMSYLSGLPLDTLKIDRSFVSKLGKSDEDDAIVSAIVTLAKALNLKITAEGIETTAQLNHLQAMNCENGQGYLYSRPVSAIDLTSLLTGKFLESQKNLTGGGLLRAA